MESHAMFGFYDAFPQKVHRIKHFATPISSKKLQHTLTQLLHELNKKTLRLEDASMSPMTNCDTVFEFGIAEKDSFNYLDDEETTRTIRIIQKSSLQILDFLCVVRYHRIENETRKPLRFDYYMLRFTFNPKFLELQLFHERGPMHILPEDLIDFVIKKINEAFCRRVLTPLGKV